MEDYLYSDITHKIIGSFFTVRNKLGFGFLKVYENALKFELEKNGFKVEKQKPISVFYEGCLVGEYFADLIVDDLVILELKCVEFLCEEHEAQLINYLKASGKKVGLLMNFGKNVEVRRKISSNGMQCYDKRQIEIMLRQVHSKTPQ